MYIIYIIYICRYECINKYLYIPIYTYIHIYIYIYICIPGRCAQQAATVPELEAET